MKYIGKHRVDHLISEMVKMSEQVRVYIICNAYEMNIEANCDKAKVAWYIKVWYDLIDGDLDLTDIEEYEFISLHFKYLEILKNKYTSFEELPINSLLDRFDLLKELGLN